MNRIRNVVLFLSVLGAAVCLAGNKTDKTGLQLTLPDTVYAVPGVLLRHKDRWYCVFREGEAHVSPDGALRVITSRLRH